MPSKLLVPVPPELTNVNVLLAICTVLNPQTPSITSRATLPGDWIAKARLFKLVKLKLVNFTVIAVTVPAKPLTLMVEAEEVPVLELTLVIPLPEVKVCAEAPPPSASMKPIVLKTDVVVRRVTNIPPSGATSIIVPK
jgi:hypothetical protein